MFKLLVESTMRNWFVFFGGILVARGDLDQSTADTLPGLGMAVIGLLASYANAWAHHLNFRRSTPRSI